MTAMLLAKWEYGPETQRRERILIVQTPDLSEKQVYAKERRLVEEVKAELARGRRCQIYAVYTQKRDVTRRLEDILTNGGYGSRCSPQMCLLRRERAGMSANSAAECRL